MIHPTAQILSNRIGAGVQIGAYACVGRNTSIGRGVTLHPHAVIGDNVELGDDTEVFPGAVVGKEPKGAGGTSCVPVFDRCLVIGSGTSIGPHAVLYYGARIGSRTLIGDGASIRERCTIGNRCIISRYVTLNYNVHVGDRSKIMDMSHITGNTRIAADVFVSTHVATVNDNTLGTPASLMDDLAGPVLEAFSKIGANAVLLPGIVVGHHAIVGSGAVVTRDVAPCSVVMGIPARVMRRLPQEPAIRAARMR